MYDLYDTYDMHDTPRKHVRKGSKKITITSASHTRGKSALLDWSGLPACLPTYNHSGLLMTEFTERWGICTSED